MQATDDPIRAHVHVLVRGHVQGVFFRATAQHVARQQGLAGWVQNLEDGHHVEAHAWGPRQALESFVAWCHQGPERAQVEEVVVRWGEGGEESGEDFVIRR